MLECYQFRDMSILEHGLSVAAWFRDLHGHLASGSPLAGRWRLPDWIYDPILVHKLLDANVLEIYQVYHDCGKPFCRTVDSEGQQHFPNHAEISRQRWLEHSAATEDCRQIGRLIGMDMDIHLLRSDGLEEFARRTEAISLLLTGLCEIHSNAEMFGGIESTGFKIKWKHINKLGRRIIELVRREAGEQTS